MALILSRPYPIIAHPFWRPMVDSLYEQMYHNRIASHQVPLISEADLGLIVFSNNIPDIIGIISENYDRWAKSIRRHVRTIV